MYSYSIKGHPIEVTVKLEQSALVPAHEDADPRLSLTSCCQAPFQKLSLAFLRAPKTLTPSLSPVNFCKADAEVLKKGLNCFSS